MTARSFATEELVAATGGVAGVVFALDWVEQGVVLTPLAGADIALVAAYRYVDLSDPVTPGVGLSLTIAAGVVVPAAGGAGLRD